MGQYKWANATNADGSYFVWVPRFAYRISYYNSDNNLTGYFDGRGMVDLEGNPVTSVNGATITPRETTIIKNGTETKITASVLDDKVNVVEQNGFKYIVHPAFENNTDLGGWSTDLSGIWVAKYEMSKENYNSGTNKWIANGTTNNGGGDGLTTKANNAVNSKNDTETVRTVSKPSDEDIAVSSWRNITIANCFMNSYYYDRNKESHQMKNSEWGAVAYLTQSQYGRNGQEVDINNSSDYLTGNGGGAVGGSVSTSSGITNYYNSANGVKASSTGNIYGIYDLSGGAYEYVTGFYSASTSSYLTTIKSVSNWEKYATPYTNTANAYQGTEIYNVGKNGDSTKEVYAGYIESNYRGWNKDYSFFVDSDFPFFLRGGYFSSGAGAGVFCAGIYDGIAGSSYGFRVVLAQ